MFSEEQKKEIQDLASFCFKNIKNNNDFENYEDSIESQNAVNLYTSITGLFWNGSFQELITYFFTMYCEIDQDMFNRLNLLQIGSLKIGMIALEKELALMRTKETDFFAYMKLMVLIDKHSALIVEKTIYELGSQCKNYLKELSFLRMQLLAAIVDEIHEDSQFMITLESCFEFFAAKYFASECDCLELAFESGNLDDIMLLSKKHQRLLRNNTKTFSVNQSQAAKIFDFEEFIFQSLCAYSNIIIAYLAPQQDIEANMLSIYAEMNFVDCGKLHYVKDRIITEKLLTKIANLFLASDKATIWQENGKILPQSSLINKIDFLTLLQRYLHGPDLIRALRLKFSAEKLYVETLRVEELIEYYYYVAKETTSDRPLAYSLVYNRDNSKIREHDLRLLTHIANTLDQYAPGWDLRQVPEISYENMCRHPHPV